jgi:hypothetical protein
MTITGFEDFTSSLSEEMLRTYGLFVQTLKDDYRAPAAQKAKVIASGLTEFFKIAEERNLRFVDAIIARLRDPEGTRQGTLL